MYHCSATAVRSPSHRVSQQCVLATDGTDQTANDGPCVEPNSDVDRALRTEAPAAPRPRQWRGSSRIIGTNSRGEARWEARLRGVAKVDGRVVCCAHRLQRESRHAQLRGRSRTNQPHKSAARDSCKSQQHKSAARRRWRHGITTKSSGSFHTEY